MQKAMQMAMQTARNSVNQKEPQRATHSAYQMVQQTVTNWGMNLEVLMAHHLDRNLALQKETSLVKH